MIGGAFMGNTVTGERTTNPVGQVVPEVHAKNEINPAVLRRADELFERPGGNTLHEVTEAYQGALISQLNRVSAGVGSETNPIYKAAHSAATEQSGEIRSRYLDRMGFPTPGMLPGVIQGAEFYAVDAQGRERPIMRIMQ
ncbi:hypothetical protein D3H65_16750 [Paraflavitalea soli]|uniref:Uncharacterized protein n=2 Tax=Paraflavitalea soli TaxID=2315862 RepID=A0A3B7MRC7_9BACT|nr:hypothetical protein D3H65_16750 [Paraflavitalea soli]